MGVTHAATKRLYRLRKQLATVRKELVPELVEELGKAALEVVEQSFDRGQDPDGKPWAGVKRGGTPLVRTGRLRDSFRLRPVGKNGFVISSDAVEARPAVVNPRKSSTVIPRGSRKYAQIVQGPRSIVWRRRHLGKRWRKAFVAAMKRVLKKHEDTLQKI